MNVVKHFLPITACGQLNVTESIGFNKDTDSAKEGNEQTLTIQLEPNSVDTDISGRVVPLSVSQYADYEFTSYTQRVISQEVQNIIDAIMDTPECE